MRCGRILSPSDLLLAAFGLALAAPSVVFGQAGVVVDAQGVLRTKTAADSTGQLTRERKAAARASLGPQWRRTASFATSR